MFSQGKMSKEMKLQWVVVFALRGDALDWWNSWKESNQKFGIVFWIQKMKAKKTEATLKFKKRSKN